MCVGVLCVCIYASWAVRSRLSEPGRRVSDEEAWGRGMWIDLEEWAQGIKIFIPHVNAHQRAFTVEEAFNRHVTELLCQVTTAGLCHQPSSAHPRA